MIGFALCVLAFVVTFQLSRRSLGRGLGALFAFGYAYGALRAIFHDMASQFIFDAAIFGLLVQRFSAPISVEERDRSAPAGSWALVLIVWPIVCLLYSPLLPGTQPVLIQILGLRDAIYTVPLLVIGARMKRSDMDSLAGSLAVLNLFALGIGMVQYFFGIDSILPRNEATELAYLSKDIFAGGSFIYRIPSTFVMSHEYGLSMMLSVPFVVHGFDSSERKVRFTCWAGFFAASIGTFISGSRLSVVILAVVVAFLLLTTVRRPGLLAAMVIAAGTTAYIVFHEERFQRSFTLTDTSYVRERLGWSANYEFVDLMMKYPLGAGLAKAVGTSIPYFLSSGAQEPVGMENEYSRILVEQGLVGLACWVAMICFAIFGGMRFDRVTSALGANCQRVVVAVVWATAFLGGGAAYMVPGGALLMLHCGMRLARSAPAAGSIRTDSVALARRSHA